MSKMIQIATVTETFTSSPQSQAFASADLQKYLDNGWTLFSTHFVGIVGPEFHMAYVFVKYEAELVPQQALIVDAPAKRRGRPPKAKVEEVLEPEATPA